MTFADGLLTTLATPRPRVHVISRRMVGGYLHTECTCNTGAHEVLGNDESSRSASNRWALEHEGQNK